MDGHVDAYSEAIRMLVGGAMPVIIDAEDGMHVLSILPSNRDAVEAMVNPDADARLRFIVTTVVQVREAVEAGHTA